MIQILMTLGHIFSVFFLFMIRFGLWLLFVPGGLESLILPANLVWLVTTVMRAWGVLTLYKKESARQAGGL